MDASLQTLHLFSLSCRTFTILQSLSNTLELNAVLGPRFALPDSESFGKCPTDFLPSVYFFFALAEGHGYSIPIHSSWIAQHAIKTVVEHLVDLYVVHLFPPRQHWLDCNINHPSASAI
jgi:hypothetical protein